MSGITQMLVVFVPAAGGGGPTFTTVGTSDFTGTAGSFPPGFTNLDNVQGLVLSDGTRFYSPYGAYSGARFVGTFTNDQFASCVLGSTSGSFVASPAANADAIGVICRASTDVDTARDFYFAYVDDNQRVTYGKAVNGVVTNFALNSTVTTWAVGDVLRLYCLGTTIAVQKNGTTILSTTDSDLTTGNPGVLARAGANTLMRGDDGIFGNVT